jgi:hypothetical protein
VATKGKRKTTMAKLAREGKLREQRAVKKAKKDRRKLGLPDESIAVAQNLNEALVGDRAEAADEPAPGDGAAVEAPALDDVPAEA